MGAYPRYRYFWHSSTSEISVYIKLHCICDISVPAIPGYLKLRVTRHIPASEMSEYLKFDLTQNPSLPDISVHLESKIRLTSSEVEHHLKTPNSLRHPSSWLHSQLEASPVWRKRR